MDTSILLSLSGIVVSLCFGVWGVYLAIRYRYPGQISFVSEREISLHQASDLKIPGLETRYKGEPVRLSLYLLGGAIVNTGRIDIHASDIKRPISIGLPDDCAWKEGGLVSHSKEMEPVVFLDHGKLIINPVHMRRGEYVRFQAIAEVSDEVATKFLLGPRNPISKALKFNHRILNFESIRHVSYDEEAAKQNFFQRHREFVYLGLLLLFMPLIFWVMLTLAGPMKTFAYGIEIDNSVTYFKARIGPYDSIFLTPLEGGDVLTLEFDDFAKHLKGAPIVSLDPSSFYAALVASALILLMFISSLLLAYIYHRKNRVIGKVYETS